MSEAHTRTYEVGFILAPSVADADVLSSVDTLKAVITKAEGTVGAEQAPEFIDLAYTMEKSIASKKMKYSQGYFGWIKFDASPEAVEGIKKVLDGMTDIVRYLITKSNLENAVVFRKPKIEAIRALSEEALDDMEEVIDEDIKEDHEMLPDVASDIEELAVPVAEEQETESKE